MAGHSRPVRIGVLVVAPAVVASVIIAVRAPAGVAVARGASSSPTWSAHQKSHGSGASSSALASTTGGVQAALAGSGESEVAALRTQSSRTFLESDGTRRLVAATHPLNYRDGSGAWQPIDDSLVSDAASGFAWRNTADSYTAEFPADLGSGPVRVSAGGQWVAFQLRGAHGVGTVSGNTITYAGAVPGVDISYAALPTGLKESLTLSSSSAASSFTFDVSTSQGMTSSSSGTTVRYSGAGGLLFTMLRPWVADATGDDQSGLSAVTVGVAPAGAHAAAVTVGLSSAWLTAPARVYPITLDPTLVRSGTDITDCHMSSNAPNTNFCTKPYLRIGFSTPPDDIRRALVKFDVSPIPGDSFIQDADLQLYMTSLTGASSLPIQVLQNCTDWTSAATWNSPDGVGSWSGGDVCNSSLFNTTVSSANTWYHWHVSSLVQTWVNGGPGNVQNSTNRGMLLHRNGTSTVALAEFSSSEATSNTPLMTIYYTAMVGGSNGATYLPRNLTGHATLGVNPATGNVMLRTSDLNVRGTGVNFQLQHVYNSRLAKQQLASPDSGPTEGLSAGWTASIGNDVFLRRYGGPSPVFVMRMPDGSWIRFYRHDTDNSWDSDQVASPGVRATLKVNFDGAGMDRVVFHDTGINYLFTSIGTSSPFDATLQAIKNKHGQTITINRAGGDPAGAITSVTDTHGRSFTYTHTNGVLSQVTDVAGSRSVSFTPDNQNRLGTFSDANGKNYVYGYDSTSGLLNSITTPGNRSITLDYDSQGRIYHLYRSTAPGDTCTTGTTNTWTFAYIALDGGQPANGSAVGETTITDPTGAVTKYYYDAQRRIVRVKDAQGRNRDANFDPSSGMATSYVDNLSNAFTLVDDTNRNLKSITAPADPNESGQTALGVSYTFNSNDGTPGTSTGSDQTNPTSMTDSAGNVTTYGLSTDRNDIISVTNQASGHNIQIHYNPNGNYLAGTVDTVTDPNSEVTQYLYFDPSVNNGYNQGDLKTIQTPGPQGDKQFTYDNDSRVNVITDGAGRTSDDDFDNLDRLTKITFSDGTFEQYTYDDDDNLIARRDRSGRTTTIDYDGYNRPVTQHEPWRVPSLTDSYCYDARDNLTQLTDAGGTVGYAYNNASDLTAVTEPGGSNCTSYTWNGTLPPANSRCIIFDYDSNARRDGTAYPGAVKQALTYRNSGLIKEVKSTVGATTLVDLKYDYSTTIGSVTVQTNMRHKLTDVARGNLQTTYGYDSENRLTSATNVETSASATTNYSYVYGARNRTSQTAGSTTTKYGYDDDNELCRSKNTTGSYPGCTFASGDTEYAYDGAGNLTSTGTYPSSTGLFAANYNPAGQTGTMTDLSGGNSTSMDYNDIGQNQRAQAGSAAFTNSVLGLATSTTSATLTAYTRDPQGHLLSYRVGNTPTSSTNHYYLLDSIRTVLGTTDATGTRDAAYYYAPFGDTTSATGTASSTSNRFGFASGWLDPTAIYHYGQRYYSPTLGRWTQPDPVAGSLDQPKNTSRYLYAGDDPINNLDPTGKSFFSDIGDAFSDAAGAVSDFISSGSDEFVGAIAGFAFAGICTVLTGGGGTPWCEFGGVVFGEGVTRALQAYHERFP